MTRSEGWREGLTGICLSLRVSGEFIATVRSLLRMHQVEDELRLSARQWSVTFDAINDGILLMDEGGQVLRCNTAISEIIGKPFQEIIGKAYDELLPVARDGGNSTALLKWPPTSRQETVLQIGEQWFQATMHPVSEGGLPHSAVCVMTNITERRRQDEKSDISMRHSRRAFKNCNSPDWNSTEKVSNLEQFEDVVVGRELKMIELEKEIERLKAEKGRKS